MVHINVVCVGKIKEKFFKDAIDEYSKRLSRFCSLKIIELNDEKIPENSNINIENIIKNKEGNNIISHLPKDSYIICLDLKGKSFSSVKFAEKINNIYDNINSNLTFIIGGSLGLSQEVLNRANELISFSEMTFPHQLMKLILVEQIYRSFKINNNETYHK